VAFQPSVQIEPFHPVLATHTGQYRRMDEALLLDTIEQLPIL
jgi:hypothetical protein